MEKAVKLFFSVLQPTYVNRNTELLIHAKVIIIIIKQQQKIPNPKPPTPDNNVPDIIQLFSEQDQ